MAAFPPPVVGCQGQKPDGTYGNVSLDQTGNVLVAFDGAAASFLKSAATTNATVLKASPGTLQSIDIANVNGSYAVLVTFYNTASAPTPGTTPIVAQFYVPASTSRNIPLPVGIAFTAGISYSVTKIDSSAVALGDVWLNLTYA